MSESTPRKSCRCDTRRRRGSVLLEFALIAIAMYMLLAAVIEFGRLMHGAQTVQAAADLAAREISRLPLPPTINFTDALQAGDFAPVYSEDYLAIDLSGWTDTTQSLTDYLSTLPVPVVNQALVPLMFTSTVGGKPILRYPGALVTSQTAASGLTVMVPVVTGDNPGVGPEQIEWHRVLEEIPALDRNGNSPFNVLWTGPASSISTNILPGGVVAVRLNYPFQAATMSGFQPPQTDANGETLPNVGTVMLADDAGVTASNAIPNGGTPVAPDAQYAGDYGGTYGGEYGLGEQGAMAQTVRPFRRMSSAQAIYRREVFGAATTLPAD